MPIERNYGPSAANVFGVNMAGAQGEENNKRLQELMQLLASIRATNMQDSLGRDRLELDKQQQAFEQRPTFAINYTPRQQPTLAERNQQLAAYRQR